MNTKEMGDNMESEKLKNQYIITSIDECPPFLNNDSPTDLNSKTRSNLFSMQTKSNLNSSDALFLKR